MFERFSQDARRVVVLAQEEARELRHSWIGTEHLLLGLVADGRGPGGRALLSHGLQVADLRRRIADHISVSDADLDSEALAMLGIDLDAVREATEAAFGPGALDQPRKARPCGHIRFSKRAKKVLELSAREAIHRKHGHIGTGHLVLGLIREGDGLAVRVLTETGIELPRLQEEVTGLIESEAS